MGQRVHKGYGRLLRLRFFIHISNLSDVLSHTYVPNCVNLMRMRPCLSHSLIPSLFLGFCICTRTSSLSPLPSSLYPIIHLSSEHPISSRKFGKVIAIISVGHAFTAHQSSRIGCTRETSMSLKVTQTRCKTPRPPIDIFKFG